MLSRLMPEQSPSNQRKGSVRAIGVSTSVAMLLAGAGILSTSAAYAQSRPDVVVGDPAPAPTTSAPQNLNDVRFSCQETNGQYTVMYNPLSQPGRFYAWANPTGMGGGWSPDRRCNEISRRLESYRPDGLQELQTSVENGYNTICVTTQQVPTCRIVLTVPPGQDPVATRDRIFNNLLVADSGQQTSAVTAFNEGDNNLINQIGQAIGVNLSGLTGQNRRSSSPSGIDLRPFLDQADGGTGARLQGGTSSQSGPSLNPDLFR